MDATTSTNPNTRSETASPESTFPDYIQRLIALENNSRKRLAEALMQEASIPRDSSQSLGPVTGDRVERGGSEHTLSSKL